MDAIWLVQPESFNPREFLPTALKPWADDARYFVSLILRKFSSRQVDDRGLVRLHAKFLRTVMHNRHTVAIVDSLVKGGAVERFPYTVGQASFGYRLSARFIGDKHIRVQARDQRLIERIELFHKKAEAERADRMKPVHVELARRQRQLQIDSTAARQILDFLPVESNPYDSQGILVENIARREFCFNVGRCGRVANCITSLKRELRTTLNVRNEPLISVDLSCAQPAFVAKLFLCSRGIQTQTQANGRGESNKPEAKSIYDAPLQPPGLADSELFRQLGQSGKLYEYLAAELLKYGIDMPRETLKRRFLCDVLAKRKANQHGAEYPSEVEDTFRKLFPSVYGFIREVNRDGWQHENLIRELQRQESQFVIETVAADLVTAHPRTFFISLHDAIYTTHRHLPKVEAAFNRGFKKLNFQMTYKVGNY